MPLRRCAVLFTLAMISSTGCSDSLSIQSRSFRAAQMEVSPTVSVVDFAGDAGGQALADILTMQLRKAGFAVVERDNVRRVVDEQKMGTQKESKLDLTDVERLELIGRNIAADIIITGELVRFVQVRYERESDDRVKFPPATCELTARAVDSKTGRVVWTCVVNVTATARNGKHVKPIDPIVEACAELVESLKNQKYQDKANSYSGAKIDAMRSERLIKS